MKAVYEVQTYTLCDGWVNTWTINILFNKKFKTIPETFQSYAEAQKAIELHLEEMEEDEMEEDRENFRVVKLNKENV